MPRVFEIAGKRSADAADSAVVDRSYAAIGYDTEALAIAAVADYIDDAGLTNIGGMTLDRVRPQEIDGIEGKWVVQAHWAPFRTREQTASPTESSFSPPEFNFEFSLAPEKIFVPIGSQTIYKQTADSNPVPTIALIGDQGDGKEPAGVDLLSPVITQSETRYVKQSALTETDRNDLLRLLGTVNTTSFRGWDPGEVLFTGVSGRARGRDDWEMNFRFQIRKNKTVSVPGFADFDVLGWEYIWPRHERIPDGSGSFKMTSKIVYLVVAQVYETSAFTDLE